MTDEYIKRGRCPTCGGVTDDKTYNARLEEIIKMGFTVIAPTQTI